MNDLLRAVEKGEQFLDAKEPNWFLKIDLDSFNMADMSHCVLGQTFGSWNRGMLELMDYEGASNPYEPNADDYGFDASYSYESYDDMIENDCLKVLRRLQHIWTEKIVDRSSCDL